MAHEEFEEPCCSRNELEHVEVSSHHTHVDDEENTKGRAC